VSDARAWANEQGVFTGHKLAALRRLLLGLLTFGLIGTAADLLLIGHHEDAWQLIPLVTIGVALAATAGLALTSPSTGREALVIPNMEFSSRWIRR